MGRVPAIGRTGPVGQGPEVRVPPLGDALQDLAESSGLRLVVLDETGHVVAYSLHETAEDRARLSYVLAHADTWPAPAADGGTRRASPNGQASPYGRATPYRQTTPHGTAVLVPLHDNRTLVGHLLHFGDPDGAPATRVRDALAQVAVLVSLQRLYAAQDRERSGELLRDLVAGAPERRESAAATLVAEGLVGASERYCVVSLGPLEEARDAGSTRTALQSTMDLVNKQSTATVAGAMLEGRGVLVFPRPVVHERLDKLVAAAGPHEVRAGIGTLVPRLEEAHRSFQQAELARRGATLAPGSHGRVTAWGDLGLDRLLLRLPLDHLGWDDLPDGVGAILQDDSAADLAATLAAFLEHGGDVAATAAALHVHRSTLYYRIGRIEQVGRCDLSDGPTRTRLHVGLRVARLAGLAEAPIGRA